MSILTAPHLDYPFAGSLLDERTDERTFSDLINLAVRSILC